MLDTDRIRGRHSEVHDYHRDIYFVLNGMNDLRFGGQVSRIVMVVRDFRISILSFFPEGEYVNSVFVQIFRKNESFEGRSKRRFERGGNDV